MQHLVFYDGTCGLCDQTVQLLLKFDKRELFAFAPLQGEVAKTFLKDLPDSLKTIDSLILVENYQTNPRCLVMSAAVFRICWLLGGAWKLLGWLSFLPPQLFNWLYRLVARNRHLFFRNDVCVLPTEKDKHRFL